MSSCTPIVQHCAQHIIKHLINSCSMNEWTCECINEQGEGMQMECVWRGDEAWEEGREEQNREKNGNSLEDTT